MAYLKPILSNVDVARNMIRGSFGSNLPDHNAAGETTLGSTTPGDE